MTQSADQPLLQEADGLAEPTPTKRRRSPAAKARSSAATSSSAEGEDGATPKARAPRRSKKAAETSELPGLAAPGVDGASVSSLPSAVPEAFPEQTTAADGEKPAPRKRAPRARKAASADETAEPVSPSPAAAEAPSFAPPAPAAELPPSTPSPAPAVAPVPPRPAPAPFAPPAGTARGAEEWSPPRPAPAPAPRPAPAPAAEQAAPTEAPLSGPARKYPVYIPRHVAKQMEEQGETAPLAVPADAIPEAARPALEAAQQARQIAARSEEPAAAGHPPAAREHERDRDRDGGRDRGRGRGRHGRERHREREGDFAREQDPERDYVAEAPLEGEVSLGEGIIEISGKGFGFLRDPKRAFAQHPQDIFVTPELVRRFHLRDGQWIKGETRRGGRGAQLCHLLEVNGQPPENARILPAFDELTVISPMERILMETTPERNTTRIIDLFCPIGKGQRGLIVAPPRTGKTTFLQHIADAVVKNHPDIALIILLVDERPEEVTDIRRSVPKAEVMASSNDMDVKSHTRIAQLAIERAKRLVESGRDVFILLDSITRVARAFNNAMTGGGRTMSGGVDSRALEIPRRIFAAARNTEEAGSLTIVATALIETGGKQDEVIFQEFKGTGNMELVLDRKISEQRIYPAIDLFQSGTRREELLIPADDLHKIAIIRRGLAGHKPMEAAERLLFFLRKFPTNAQMLREIPG